MGSSSLKEHLPSASSIYTAELRAIILGFKLICKSPKEHFIICTDSLSCLLAIRNLKQDHHLLHEIFNFYTYAVAHQHKTVMFCWVPSHVGIQGNERVDALAKLALSEPYTTRQSEMADLARRATRWVGTFPYILTPIPNLYDHSFPRYGQITFLTFRRPTTLTFDLKF